MITCNCCARCEADSSLWVCRGHMGHVDCCSRPLLLAADKCQKGVDDAEVLGILHSLYSMTFTSQGRESVAFVFSLDDNLKVLLPFLEVTGMIVLQAMWVHASLLDHYIVA